MKKSLVRIVVIALSFAPGVVFAHPGHADDAPVIHELSHTLHYLVAVIAAGIVVAQILAYWRQSRIMGQDR